MKFYLFILIVIFFHLDVSGQYSIEDSCGMFTLTILAENLDSDSIGIAISDCESPGDMMDTLRLVKGKTVVKGYINRATEAIIFSNIHSRLLDGPQVVRFLIEPGTVSLNFSAKDSKITNVVIEGSNAQKEKEIWEANHALLLKALENYWNKLIEFHAQNQGKNNLLLEKKLAVLQDKYDALKELLIAEVLDYASTHPDSYFSTFLLYHYKRSIQIDTLKTYFTYLSPNAANCDLGKEILKELLHSTSDWSLRKKFLKPDLYKSLTRTNSIYDVSLPDIAGNELSFSDFAGNFLLIDFWADWCPPCIANIPYLKKLEAELSGKPFKIISVSIDRTEELWRKSIEKYKFPGINLWDNKGLLSMFLKVTAVPRYILFRPDGTISVAELPHPDDPSLKSTILRQLTKDANLNAK